MLHLDILWLWRNAAVMPIYLCSHVSKSRPLYFGHISGNKQSWISCCNLEVRLISHFALNNLTMKTSIDFLRFVDLPFIHCFNVVVCSGESLFGKGKPKKHFLRAAFLTQWVILDQIHIFQMKGFTTHDIDIIADSETRRNGTPHWFLQGNT